MDIAEKYSCLSTAINFLLSWPAPAHAAKIAEIRAAELDGNRYNTVTQAAGALVLNILLPPRLCVALWFRTHWMARNPSVTVTLRNIWQNALAAMRKFQTTVTFLRMRNLWPTYAKSMVESMAFGGLWAPEANTMAGA